MVWLLASGLTYQKNFLVSGNWLRTMPVRLCLSLQFGFCGSGTKRTNPVWYEFYNIYLVVHTLNLDWNKKKIQGFIWHKCARTRLLLSFQLHCVSGERTNVLNNIINISLMCWVESHIPENQTSQILCRRYIPYILHIVFVIWDATAEYMYQPSKIHNYVPLTGGP